MAVMPFYELNKLQYDIYYICCWLLVIGCYSYSYSINSLLVYYLLADHTLAESS